MKHRPILILALAVSALVPACAGQANPTSRMRVATYNIEWFSEDANPQRIANLKSVLNNIAPDVVGLQEIQSKKALTQIFDDRWEIGIADEASEPQETGIAVRKPFRLESYDQVFKDRTLDEAFPGKRDAFRAVVVAPSGQKISFYVLHLKSRSGGRRQTDHQRIGAAGLLASYIKMKREENVVVLGDLNDAPDDVSVNILETGDLNATHGKLTPKNPILVNLCEDLYRTDHVTFGLHDNFKGQDLPSVVPGAFRENERTRGIDYRYPQDLSVLQVFFDQILVSPNLKPRVLGTAKVYSAADALRGRSGRQRRGEGGNVDYQQKGDLASDHLPVYADIRLGS